MRALIIATALSAIIGAGAGWHVRARIADATETHLRRTIAEVSARASGWARDYATARANVATLTQAIERQNSAIAQIRSAHEAAAMREATTRRRLAAIMAMRAQTRLDAANESCETLVEAMRRQTAMAEDSGEVNGAGADDDGG